MQDKCRQIEPPLRTAGSPDHLFACWFPLVNGVSTAPSVRSTADGAVIAGATGPVATPGPETTPGQMAIPGTAVPRVPPAPPGYPGETPIDPDAEVGTP